MTPGRGRERTTQVYVSVTDTVSPRLIRSLEDRMRWIWAFE